MAPIAAHDKKPRRQVMLVLGSEIRDWDAGHITHAARGCPTDSRPAMDKQPCSSGELGESAESIGVAQLFYPSRPQTK